MNDNQRAKIHENMAKKLHAMCLACSNSIDIIEVFSVTGGLADLLPEELALLLDQVSGQAVRNMTTHIVDGERVERALPTMKPEPAKPTPAPAPAHKPAPITEPEDGTPDYVPSPEVMAEFDAFLEKPKPEPKPEPVFHRDPVGFYITFGAIESYKAVQLLDSVELRKLHRLYGKGKYNYSTSPATIIEGVRKEANRGSCFAKPEPTEPTTPRIYQLLSRFQEVNCNYDLLRSALEAEATDLQLAHTVRKYRLPEGGNRAANIEKLVQYVKTSRGEQVEEKPIDPKPAESWLDLFGEL